MGRGTEQAAQNMAAQNQALFQQQQAAALQQQQAATAAYQKQITDLTAKNPYDDPTYQKNLQTLAKTVTQGVASKAAGNAQNFNLQTGGQNQPQMKAAVGEAKRQSQRDESDFLTNQKNVDWNNYQNLKQFGAAALGDIPALYQDVYGAASQGISTTGQQLAQVANQNVGSGTGSKILGAITAICPCAGGLITMFDVSESLVEELMAGELLLSVDGLHDKLLDRPVPVDTECVRVTTQTGKKAEVGVKHTWIRPGGGYVYAHECRGELVKTKDGAERVESVVPIGWKKVYPLILDRTRTYLLNGIWSEA